MLKRKWLWVEEKKCETNNKISRNLIERMFESKSQKWFCACNGYSGDGDVGGSSEWMSEEIVKWLCYCYVIAFRWLSTFFGWNSEFRLEPYELYSSRCELSIITAKGSEPNRKTTYNQINFGWVFSLSPFRSRLLSSN